MHIAHLATLAVASVADLYVAMQQNGLI